MPCIVSCTMDSNFRVSSAVHTLHNAQSLKWLKHWNGRVSNELQWNTVHEVLPFQCFNTWVIAVCSVSELDKKHWMTVWVVLQKLVCMQVEQQQAWGRIIEQQHSHWSSWTIHIKYIQDLSQLLYINWARSTDRNVPDVDCSRAPVAALSLDNSPLISCTLQWACTKSATSMCVNEPECEGSGSKHDRVKPSLSCVQPVML